MDAPPFRLDDLRLSINLRARAKSTALAAHRSFLFFRGDDCRHRDQTREGILRSAKWKNIGHLLVGWSKHCPKTDGEFPGRRWVARQQAGF
jgi:hypothetical protein